MVLVSTAAANTDSMVQAGARPIECAMLALLVAGAAMMQGQWKIYQVREANHWRDYMRAAGALRQQKRGAGIEQKCRSILRSQVSREVDINSQYLHHYLSHWQQQPSQHPSAAAAVRLALKQHY